ncbi:hypothetical protein P43SY_008194 [Pythium insidiosum]|uniref:Uncharacterized protein n=1 Tax=Pythium insidiosum TaxID=114742 RepID=A0AAD5M920_PYTIN|nr:hypothetical protein P43SY_008194 [Pythium insidiosum]
MVKRTASEANVGDNDSPAVQQHRPSAESPIPPSWRVGHAPRFGEPSVEPQIRVRAVPKLPSLLSPGDLEAKSAVDDTRMAADPAIEDEDDDVPAMTAQFSVVTPQPRRVVSPELIFQSAAESLKRHNRVFSSTDAETPSDLSSLLELSRRRTFRPIAVDRPDVEITSPPLRATNPVVQDTRFQLMQRLDLQLDASVAPLQPFCPRPRRRSPPPPASPCN